MEPQLSRGCLARIWNSEQGLGDVFVQALGMTCIKPAKFEGSRLMTEALPVVKDEEVIVSVRERVWMCI